MFRHEDSLIKPWAGVLYLLKMIIMSRLNYEAETFTLAYSSILILNIYIHSLEIYREAFILYMRMKIAINP